MIQKDKNYCCNKCSYMIEGDCKISDNDNVFNKEVLKEQMIDVDINDFYICPEFTMVKKTINDEKLYTL